MDFGTHLLAGFIIAHFMGISDPSIALIVVLASILPDLIGEIGYRIGSYKIHKKFNLFYTSEVSLDSKKLGKSVYLYPYNLAHSFLIVGLMIILSLPAFFIIPYVSHIFIDLLSHGRHTWGIMPLWPIFNNRFGTKKDWWEWRLLKGRRFLLCNLITYTIFVLYLIIKK